MDYTQLVQAGKATVAGYSIDLVHYIVQLRSSEVRERIRDKPE
jgi:hypothetical protein